MKNCKWGFQDHFKWPLFFLTREISCYLYNHKLEFPSGWFIDIDDTWTSSNFVYFFHKNKTKIIELFFLVLFYPSIIFRANKVGNFQSCFSFKLCVIFFIEKESWKNLGETLKVTAPKCVSFSDETDDAQKIWNSGIEMGKFSCDMLFNLFTSRAMKFWADWSAAGAAWDDGSFLRSRAPPTHTNAPQPGGLTPPINP